MEIVHEISTKGKGRETTWKGFFRRLEYLIVDRWPDIEIKSISNSKRLEWDVGLHFRGGLWRWLPFEQTTNYRLDSALFSRFLFSFRDYLGASSSKPNGTMSNSPIRAGWRQKLMSQNKSSCRKSSRLRRIPRLQARASPIPRRSFSMDSHGPISINPLIISGRVSKSGLLGLV